MGNIAVVGFYFCWVYSMHQTIMRGSRKFCERGVQLRLYFLVDEGRKDPNTTISGPSLARQQNVI